ncbi:peptidase domain-containing ABC transporter [Roseivirga sp. BDSF3-8]|uniref:peptidase domain-containing ABC transporter n=1 Tax=Roseivirga sp. BDSF3-8 TaxID=3241598 RepID=UPI003531C9EE
MFGRLKKFPNYKQADSNDCGPTCLRMVAKHYGKDLSGPAIRKLVYRGSQGANLLNLSDSADTLGFRTMMVKCSIEMMEAEKPTPFIAHWNQNHYVVVYKIKNGKFYISDPNGERGVLDKEAFRKSWCSARTDGEDEGIALLFETTPKFYTFEVEEEEEGVNLKFYLKYIIPHWKLILQLAIGLGLGSIFSLITPFLTQAMVDQGIQNNDMNFVYVVLIAQVMMFLGTTTIELIRSWVMLHMSTRINISVLSDFLVKLMKLPLGFFDAKNLGDIMQRMGDHSRIESFLTSQSLSIVFSLLNLVVYSFVMFTYSIEMYGIFVISSVLYFLWVIAFLKKRKELDYKNFGESANNQNATVGLIQGMQEIKLHTCEKQRRWEWERVQIRLFKLSIKSLILEQFQGTGSSFISHLKTIVISFWAAKEVIEGNMTLGMMMAATQILGQLDGPINQFVGFIQQAQDAKISLERLGEIHNRKDEDADSMENSSFTIPENQGIEVKNLSFRYGDPTGLWVLDNLSMTIPYGKTTAIVGESGSGKTTLMKLLLRFYEPEKGEILLGNTNLQHLNAREWRKRCGAVLQEGHIFSDTIARNIAIADENPDVKRLMDAADTANARMFIENMPLNYNTKIGAEGKDLSTGQKQRLRIARAVYKNPEYIFFDEASSSLDANNEREITEKIARFNRNRTAVIIAHRLSTVRHADNIVVLQKGRIAEQGTHEELTAKRGLYFDLVKNQLELAT